MIGKRRSLGRTLRAELLERRELLAADLGSLCGGPVSEPVQTQECAQVQECAPESPVQQQQQSQLQKQDGECDGPVQLQQQDQTQTQLQQQDGSGDGPVQTQQQAQTQTQLQQKDGECDGPVQLQQQTQQQSRLGDGSGDDSVLLTDAAMESLVSDIDGKHRHGEMGDIGTAGAPHSGDGIPDGSGW